MTIPYHFGGIALNIKQNVNDDIVFAKIWEFSGQQPHRYLFYHPHTRAPNSGKR